MPLTNGSGSGSCYFCQWPSRCQLKTNLKKSFSAYYFLKEHLHHFSKIKNQKVSQNSRNRGFSYYFGLMIEGSGTIPLISGSGSGSIHLIRGSGSGSRRPKNILIRRIRIRNTACHSYHLSPFTVDWASISCWWASIPIGEVCNVWPQEGEQRVHPGGWGPRLDLHWQVSHPPFFLKLQPLENYAKIVIIGDYYGKYLYECVMNFELK